MLTNTQHISLRKSFACLVKICLVVFFVLGCAEDAFAAVGDQGPSQFIVRNATIEWTIGGTVDVSQEYSERTIYIPFVGWQYNFYIVVSAHCTNPHYTTGSWSTNNGLGAMNVNQNAATILTSTAGNYWYKYTFTYKPEITSVSGKAIEADGSQCTDPNVSVAANMEETVDPNGFAPGTPIHLHSSCNDPTFYFDHWEKKIGNGNPQTFQGGAECTYSVDNTDPEQNIELIAVFRRKPKIIIEVIELPNQGNNPIGNTGGTVKINDEQYASPFYLEPNSSNNRLEAFLDEIHTFDHWAGQGISTGFWFITNPHQQNPYANGNSYAVGQTDVTVQVYFRKKPTITITILEVDENGNSTDQIAGGTVSADNEQIDPFPYSAIYTEGNQIQLKAEPAENYCFDRWDVTGYLVYLDRNQEITYTVGSSDATITAVFRKQPDQANYDRIVIDPECGGSINFHRWSSDGLYTALLQAVPNSPNYEFYRWDLDNAIGNFFLDNTGNPTMVSLIDRGNGYTLRFRKVKSTIKFSCVDDESGQLLSGTEPQDFHPNINSDFTPTAPDIDCYELIRWDIFKASGECESIPSERTDFVIKDDIRFPNFSYHVDINDAEIHAVYQKKQFTIYAVVVDEATKESIAGGIVSGAGTYVCGTSATLEAPTITCYTFVGWQKKNGETWQDVGTNPTLNVTVEANAEYRAVFSPKTFNVSVLSEDETTGVVLTSPNIHYPCGEILLKAKPGDCYKLKNWTDSEHDKTYDPAVQSSEYTFSTDAEGNSVLTLTLTGYQNEAFNFVAHFEKVTYTVTAIPDDPSHGSTTVTIVAP